MPDEYVALIDLLEDTGCDFDGLVAFISDTFTPLYHDEHFDLYLAPQEAEQLTKFAHGRTDHDGKPAGICR